jgi:hypothetical protein
MLMGLATYGMNDCHDACYMRHEPLPFHMIWHNTWPIFHDTVGIDTCMHICTSIVCIHAYVCHMTHGIKRWQISNPPTLTSLPIISFQQEALIKVL